jgi:dGTPase
LYRHPQVEATMDIAKQVVRDLFQVYASRPEEMQSGFAHHADVLAERPQRDPNAAMRVVADYIAGMTDRFAAKEHQRLTGQQLLP